MTMSTVLILDRLTRLATTPSSAVTLSVWPFGEIMLLGLTLMKKLIDSVKSFCQRPTGPWSSTALKAVSSRTPLTLLLNGKLVKEISSQLLIVVRRDATYLTVLTTFKEQQK